MITHGGNIEGVVHTGICCGGRLNRAPRTHRARTASRNHLSQSVRTILLFTVFFSQCPAARARRGTLAFSLPARTRESTPRLSPRLLTGAEVTRAEGPQSARLFAIGTISEPISIGQK